MKMIEGDILELCYLLLLFCCLPGLCLLILCGSKFRLLSSHKIVYSAEQKSQVEI